MANNIWTKTTIVGAASELDEVEDIVNRVIEEAQSWNSRPWIQLEYCHVDGPDVAFGIMTDWEKGDAVVHAVAEAIPAHRFEVSFNGDCEPSEGSYSLNEDAGEASSSELAEAAEKKTYIGLIVAMVGGLIALLFAIFKAGSRKT